MKTIITLFAFALLVSGCETTTTTEQAGSTSTTQTTQTSPSVRPPSTMYGGGSMH